MTSLELVKKQLEESINELLKMRYRVRQLKWKLNRWINDKSNTRGVFKIRQKKVK